MKKIYSILTIFAFALLLVACGDTTGGGGNVNPDPDPDPDPDPVEVDPTASLAGLIDIEITQGDSFDPMTGVTATDTVDGNITNRITVTGAVLTNTPGTYVLTYKVVGSDGKTVQGTRTITVKPGSNLPPATEIVIMHGAVHEIDPFHPNYTGRETLARQAKQREVEDRLNVKVVYKPYPASAAWGPSRVEAIIQGSVSGTPLADIYWTTSDWTAQLASGNAIVPVDQYLATHGNKITQEVIELGSWNDQFWSFMVNRPTVDVGLYYNSDLVEQLGIENPAELFLNGEWTWTKFDQWATAAKSALTVMGDDYYALGGVLANYAENMVPLNGGALINAKSGRVAFHQTAALETYAFIKTLWEKGLFEPGGQFDAGSPSWQAGKVLMHPGSFWFLGSPDRWGGLNFKLSFVPYPMSEAYIDKGGQYVSPIGGVAVYNIASGMSAAKEELAFQVWNEIQMWKTDEEFEDEFMISLETKLNDQASIDAYLAIYKNVTLDLIGALGISKYGSTGWTAKISAAIKAGDYRSQMEAIEPIYSAALEAYLSGN